MVTWTSIYPFYEVWRVFFLHVLPSLPTGPIPLRWWHHLIQSILMAIQLADLRVFPSRTKFWCQHIPPNFGIKWFYSKITSHDRCMRRTSNHPFWSHANFFGLLANLFRWPFLTLGIPKIMMFGHLMVIILSTFWATLFFPNSCSIVDLFTFLKSGWYCNLLCTNSSTIADCRTSNRSFGLIAFVDKIPSLVY